ncbi:hypothetical protein PANDA_007461 [Ailuropoda melanoleuca]|uniref:peptide-methionine (S)-S-oxide reductase n=1 Tax=Ailuropoda melanoleuca TaxID=9646 RepID=D2HAJ6_AILME|nr:hypothetical protein PANDA_007461 [Ailuropoda melanoleuca]
MREKVKIPSSSQAPPWRYLVNFDHLTMCHGGAMRFLLKTADLLARRKKEGLLARCGCHISMWCTEPFVKADLMELEASTKHHVNGNRTVEPFPEGTQMAVFGMGCFWGAERKFWTMKGVYSTQVGYAGGYTSNPTYKEVCSGKTGHAEVVRVVYQPESISFEELLKVFWENHDPTQGMRQGNDHGTQYRSAIYPTSTEHMEVALRSKEDYQKSSLLVAMAASGESPPIGCWLRGGKKRPAVSGVVCLVPACHCFQSAAGLATLTVHAAVGRGPQGPPATAVYTTGRNGEPKVNVISFSLKCEVCEGQKQSTLDANDTHRIPCGWLLVVWTNGLCLGIYGDAVSPSFVVKCCPCILGFAPFCLNKVNSSKEKYSYRLGREKRRFDPPATIGFGRLSMVASAKHFPRVTGFTCFDQLSLDVWRLAAFHYWRSRLPVPGEDGF